MWFNMCFFMIILFMFAYMCREHGNVMNGDGCRVTVIVLAVLTFVLWSSFTMYLIVGFNYK